MKFNKVFHYFDIHYSLFDLPAMPLGRLEIAPQCLYRDRNYCSIPVYYAWQAGILRFKTKWRLLTVFEFDI